MTTRGELLKSVLTQMNNELNLYSDIRGLGLLIGAKLIPQYHGMAREIMLNGFKHGVATLIATPNVTRFTPSLIIPEIDINLGMEQLYQALNGFLNR